MTLVRYATALRTRTGVIVFARAPITPTVVSCRRHCAAGTLTSCLVLTCIERGVFPVYCMTLIRYATAERAGTGVIVSCLSPTVPSVGAIRPRIAAVITRVPVIGAVVTETTIFVGHNR